MRRLPASSAEVVWFAVAKVVRSVALISLSEHLLHTAAPIPLFVATTLSVGSLFSWCSIWLPPIYDVSGSVKRGVNKW